MNEFAYSLLLMAGGYLQQAQDLRDGLFTEADLMTVGSALPWLRWCNAGALQQIKELESLAAVYMDFYFKVMGID